MQSQDSTPWLRAPWEQLAAQRKCPNCDLLVQDDWDFCEYCGAGLSASDGGEDGGSSGPEGFRHRSAPEQPLAAHLDLTPSAQALIQLAQQEPPVQVPQPNPPAAVTQQPAALAAPVLTDLVRSAVNVVPLLGVQGDPDAGSGGLAGPVAPLAPTSPDKPDALRAVLISAYDGKSIGVVGHPVRIGPGESSDLGARGVDPGPRGAMGSPWTAAGHKLDGGQVASVGPSGAGAAPVLGPVQGAGVGGAPVSVGPVGVGGVPGVGPAAGSGAGGTPGSVGSLGAEVGPVLSSGPGSGVGGMLKSLGAGVGPGVGPAVGSGAGGTPGSVGSLGAGVGPVVNSAAGSGVGGTLASVGPTLGGGVFSSSMRGNNSGAPTLPSLSPTGPLSPDALAARAAATTLPATQPPPLSSPPPLASPTSLISGPPTPKTAPAPQAPAAPQPVERPTPTYQVGPRSYANPVSGPGGV